MPSTDDRHQDGTAHPARSVQPLLDLPARLPGEVTSPTTPDEAFQRYARLVRATLGVPVALVSLVSADGQVFPGALGLPEPWQTQRRTGLPHSFCQHVVTADEPLVVTDARLDPLLADNLAIYDLGVVAYAGFPLRGADGAAVGSLCAIDTSPRRWSEHELAVLADLAVTASAELGQRRQALQLHAARAAERRAERAATERITHITESMAVGYLALDPDWRITYVNAEGERILGPRHTLLGAVIWEAFPATVGTDFESGYRRAVGTGEPVTLEAYYPAPLEAWFEVRAVPQEEGLALYFLDITARRDAEQTRRRSAERIAALAAIALAMTDAESVADLVAVVAEQGFAALGADGGSIAVPDRDDPQQMLSYITASFGGARQDYTRLHRDQPLPLCVAAATGRPALYPDRAACLALSPQMVGAMEATGSQAFAAIPMHAGGQLVGVLTAGWASAQDLGTGSEQLGLLETLAAQCAQALQRLGARKAQQVSTAAAQRAEQVAQRSAARQAALVAIARALAAAEDQDDVVAVLAAEGAALLGSNGCGLCLREEAGATIATLVSDAYAQVRTTVQRVPADFPLPAIRAASTGEEIFLSDRDQTEAAFPGSRVIYEGAEVQASAAVPLQTRGRLLGCLSVGFTQPRDFDPEQRELLRAFAAMTTQALERITAHDAEQAALVAASGIAETLQRSMLTAPPEPDHLEIAVRYAATAKTAEVGGDWYDSFITSRGLTSLVIGDVTGHDMAAAAVMGQLRNLVRGIAFTLGEPPATVLAAVDRAAAGLGIDTVATTILAQVEQDESHRAAGTRLVRWSNAGHLPPLLIEADGTARFLEPPPDLVLGWDPAIDRHDHEVVLEPGATVLLYTDGLIERRGVHLERGLAWLAEAAAELVASPGGTLEELCDGLVELVGDHLDDDVALLALRAHPEDEPRPVEAGPAHVPVGLDRALQAAEQADAS